ncbi:MAG: F0F1 ATP synthase subunit alpha, partial [bacterium]
PTNVISITDGQIFLEANLFYSGVRPAVNVGVSVSRVGGNAQTKATKKVAGSLRLELAQYDALAAFAQFASDLDKASQQQLARGKRLVELLKQPQYGPLAMEEQVAVVFAGISGKVDDLDLGAVVRFETELLEHLRSRHADLLATIRDTKDFSDESKAQLGAALDAFKASFKA